MKHQFCLLLASVAVLASCAKGEYRISGSLKDFKGYGYEVDSVVLYVNGGNVPVTNEERIAAAIVETDSFYITGETYGTKRDRDKTLTGSALWATITVSRAAKAFSTEDEVISFLRKSRKSLFKGVPTTYPSRKSKVICPGSNTTGTRKGI